METSFQKTQKGTSLYIPIVHWSHKIYALFYTQTRTRTVYIVYLTPYTVKHFIIEWGNLPLIRQRFFFFQRKLYLGLIKKCQHG